MGLNWIGFPSHTHNYHILTLKKCCRTFVASITEHNYEANADDQYFTLRSTNFTIFNYVINIDNPAFQRIHLRLRPPLPTYKIVVLQNTFTNTEKRCWLVRNYNVADMNLIVAWNVHKKTVSSISILTDNR